MKIIVGEKSGCCFGVRRALEIAEKTRAERTGFVATLGPLIHNPRTVAELAARGIAAVKDLEDLSGGTVIIRSHGAGPEFFKKAAERGIEVVDATCPFVRLEQELAVALKEEGYAVVIVGEHDHAEVRAVKEWLDGQAYVVSPDEAEELPWEELGERIGVVSQTTQSVDGLNKVVSAILPHCRELKAHNTICLATVQRQQEVRELARLADRLVVVGGRDSANTRRLAEIGQEQGVPTILAEFADELNPAWFEGIATVAVVAGASTPRSQIQEVIDWLSQLNSGGIEEKVDNEKLTVAALEGEKNAEDFATLLQSAPRRLEEGMILKARVVFVRDDAAFVDLGWKSDLPVPLSELTDREAVSAKEVVQPGEEIRVMVVASKNQDEPFILSKRRADQESAWTELAEKVQSGETVTGRVTRAVKGGLELEVSGIRAFMPASQVGLGYIEDLAPFVGQELTCRVMEVEPNKKRALLSRRAVLEEERRRAEEKIFESLREGDKVKGKVTHLMPFGAFVDLGGGVEGLIHVSELSWERVNQPQKVVQPGEEVEVLVQKIDRDAKRISLSLKQLRPHPWERVQDRFHEGDVVEGEVARLAPFGVFVRLAEGVDGLIHISQLSRERVKDVKDVVDIGQTVRVKILSLDPANRRISLSMKELAPPPADAGEEPEDEVRTFLKNQESGRLQSNLGELFEKKSE